MESSYGTAGGETWCHWGGKVTQNSLSEYPTLRHPAHHWTSLPLLTTIAGMPLMSVLWASGDIHTCLFIINACLRSTHTHTTVAGLFTHAAVRVYQRLAKSVNIHDTFLTQHHCVYQLYLREEICNKFCHLIGQCSATNLLSNLQVYHVQLLGRTTGKECL